MPVSDVYYVMRKRRKTAARRREILKRKEGQKENACKNLLAATFAGYIERIHKESIE